MSDEKGHAIKENFTSCFNVDVIPLYFIIWPFSVPRRTVSVWFQQTLDSGFRICVSEHRFRISIVSEIPHSLSWIREFKAQSFGFRKRKFFRITHYSRSWNFSDSRIRITWGKSSKFISLCRNNCNRDLITAYFMGSRCLASPSLFSDIQSALSRSSSLSLFGQQYGCPYGFDSFQTRLHINLIITRYNEIVVKRRPFPSFLSQVFEGRPSAKMKFICMRKQLSLI